jgi:hypothetical protein
MSEPRVFCRVFQPLLRGFHRSGCDRTGASAAANQVKDLNSTPEIVEGDLV